jgi:hypothetical protein
MIVKHNNFKQGFFLLALTAVLVIGSGVIAVNSYAADGTGTATATVVTPIGITATADLRFGSFTTSAAGQTVEITTADVRNLTGATGLTSTVGAASFGVTGSGSMTYAITLPDDVTATITTGGATAPETMAVSAFASNPSGTGTLSSGAQTLLVGATITTVASQVPGAYTGTFTVTVAYN